MKKFSLSVGVNSWISTLFLILSLNSIGQNQQFKDTGISTEPLVYKSQVSPSGIIRCHTMEADSIRRAQNPNLPSLLQEEVWLQNQIQKYKSDALAKSSGGTPKATLLTLPIVFHVITSGSGATNVSAARVQAQVNQLNIDYGNLAGSSHPAAADIQIQFCLAMVDPSGNALAEPGIHRVTTYGGGTQSQGSMDGTIKPATIWNPDNYINIWVANLGSGLLGYAQFPSNSGLAGFSANEGPATTDGVVIAYTSLGSVASPYPGSAPYDKGRTLTHELGHWLGLRHIWGDASCGNDFCADTPQSNGANYGCPTKTTCDGILDMVQNYMDYTDDACMNVLTEDQKTRIRTVLSVSPRRMTLASSPACGVSASFDTGISAIINPVGDICSMTFTPVVKLNNYGSNTLTSAIINSNIDGGANSTFNWAGSLVSGASVNVTLPSLTTTAAAHTFNASASNPNGQVDANSGNNTSSSSFNVNLANGASLPITEGFVSSTFPPTGWALVNGGNSLNWARVTNTGVTPTLNNAVKMDNFTTNTAGDVDDLVVKPINLSGLTSAQMTFDLSHARYSNSYSDRLDVVVYGCGIAETVVYSKSASALATTSNKTSAFTPASASEWRNETIDLTPFVGNNRLYIAFRSVSGYGNNVYLDNINITSGVPSSPPVAGFTAGSTKVCAGQSVTYTNTSTNSPTSYAWSFAGGTPATSTATNPVVTYNTPGTFNVSLTATNASGSDVTQSSIIVDACAGIENETIKIGIAPNPTNGKLSISSKEIITSYRLYDYSGRLVIQSNEQPSAQFELDLSSYAEGVYHLVVQLESGVLTEKILLKK